MAYFHDNEIIVQKYTLPLFVPDVNESEEQSRVRWKRYRMLPEKVKDVLSDEHVMQVIQHIGKRAQFDLAQTAFLARAVRMYYFGDLPLEKFAEYIAHNTGVSPVTAQNIARTLAVKIIKKSTEEKVERLPLRTALDRFPDLGNQVITENDLRIAGAHKHVRGTIENWLTDYHLAIGQGRHTAIERGNYLFHNRNAKALSAADRQRVAMVLKSLDEDMVMAVDPSRGEVVFPVAQKVPQRTGVQAPAAHKKAQLPERMEVSQRSEHIAKKSGILKTETEQRKSGVNGKAKPAGYINFSSGQRLSRERKEGDVL